MRVSGAVDGVPQQSGSFKGEGPKTQCVRPVTGTAPVAGIATGSACVAKGGVVENGAFVIRQTCAQDMFETTIRKIDKLTWEYKTDVLQSGNSSATQQSTESAVIAMLRNARAHARTEQDRKDLDKTIAEYVSRSPDQKVAPVPAMQSQAQGGTLVRRTVMLQKWVRIADKCDVPKT
ncbi:MAG: hypothetical protein V4631_21935 [Pseudomonadota bacterium]